MRRFLPLLVLPPFFHGATLVSPDPDEKNRATLYLRTGVATFTSMEEGPFFALGSYPVTGRSEASLSAPALYAGGSLPLSPRWSLTLDGYATGSGTGDETTRIRETLLLADRTVEPGASMAENRLEMRASGLKAGVRYGLGPRFGFLAGARVDRWESDRNRWEPLDPLLVGETADTVASVVESLSAFLGVSFRSPSFSGGWRYTLEGTTGIPLRHDVEVTARGAAATFQDPTGYQGEGSALLAFPLTDTLELGLFATLSYLYREGNKKETVGSATYVWPENDLTTLSGGFSLEYRFK